MVARMTPEQEAAYALDRGLSRAELEPLVQAEYDRLLADFPARRPGQPRPARSVVPTRYHPQLIWPVHIGCSAGVALVAVSGLADARQAGVGGVVFSCFLLAFAVWIGYVTVSNSLTVTQTGIKWRAGMFRTCSLAWSDVQSLEVGPPAGLANWPAVVVTTSAGRFRIGPTTGSPKRIAKIMAELTSAWNDATRLTAEQG
jgi:hypothetical protein